MTLLLVEGKRFPVLSWFSSSSKITCLCSREKRDETHQRIICGDALTRDLRHGQQRVSPFYHIPQLSHFSDSDFHNFSSPGFLMPKMTELRAFAIRLIIGLDFAVTLSSLESC